VHQLVVKGFQRDIYLQTYNACVNMLERRLRVVVTLLIFYMLTSRMQHVNFNNFIGIYFIITVFGKIKLRICIVIVHQRPLPQFFHFT